MERQTDIYFIVDWLELYLEMSKIELVLLKLVLIELSQFMMSSFLQWYV